MAFTANLPNHVGESPVAAGESLGNQVRRAVIWRSGTQILTQIVQWGATFLVIRILDPQDYGLYAMTGAVMVGLTMFNGEGLASAFVRRDHVTHHDIRQLFGMLIGLNVALAVVQLALAPVAAAYYRQDAIAPLLRVQSLLYLTTPFIALPYALLARAMDFRAQAKANVVAALAGAGAALAGALLGWGVWTLVAAPLVLFTVRAAMMTVAARCLVWPSFDFRGAGGIVRFGGLLALVQLFWFVQSQADVLIAGRHFSPHRLGIYTTSLFLAQIVVAKFVPPLNEIAFSAYARIQHDGRATAAAFARAARVIMLVAMPCFLGLAVTAEPLVLTVLSERWAEAVPVVRLLALAMPFMTMQTLYAPACDARGRPGIAVGNGAAGALILGGAFMIGVWWGPVGLGWSWLAAYPLYLAIGTWRSLPVIGVDFGDLLAAVMPPVLAAVAMALVVHLADDLLPAMASAPRLAALIAIGGTIYGAWLSAFARPTLAELAAMLRRRPLAT